MRPIKLTISAFGPYAAKTEIDMAQLGTKGLYIIAGETGAGKTTIFDAITYALYGEPSGENRKVSMFRSKYATADTPTFVELIFECKGKGYTVTRNPEYLRPAKRGDKMVAEKANAELILPDGTIITKEKAVTAAIRDIIGIDRSRFSGIAMIAQGEFQKLLLASTEEREKIFRQIFRTHGYEQLQRKLSDEAKTLNKDRALKKSGIQQDIQMIACQEETPLFSDVEKAKKEELPIGEITKLIETLIAQDHEDKTKMQKQREERNQKKSEITAAIAKAETLEQAKQALQSDTAALEIKEGECHQTKETLTAEEAKEPLRRELQKKITLGEDQLCRYDTMDELFRKKAKSEKELRTAIQKKEDQNRHLEELQEAAAKMKKELETLKNSETNLLTLHQEKKEAEQKKEELHGITQRIGALEKQKQRCARARGLYKEQITLYTAAEERYRQSYRLFLDHQAGILAEELQEDSPCPVCGAIHHPAPAKKAENAPTEEELRTAEDQYTRAREKAEAAGRAAGTEEATFKAKTEELQSICETLPGEITPENAASKIAEMESALSAHYTKLCTHIHDEQRRSTRKKELETRLLPETESNITKLSHYLLQLTTHITEQESAIRHYEEQIKALTKELPFPTKAEAAAALQKDANTYRTMMQQLQEAKTNYDETIKAIASLKSRIEANRELMKADTVIDIEAEKQKLSVLNTEERKLNEAMENLTSRLDTNGTALNNITEKCGDLAAIEEKYRWVNALAETANGNLRGKGKEKIKLETYVQMTYFDRIIRRANIRLMTMTNGQYDLKRAREATDSRSQTGLDLNVIDHYNGSERSVRTLSGGESFKASLALALGLSDEIRSSAGGISIDSMFVDEGFGSLDEDSLHQAIKALNDLTQGNRLVGIISHVADLKEKIEKQIIVTKTKTSGSKVEVIC